MKIVVVNKDSIMNIPPLLSVVYILLEEGHSLHILTSGISKDVQEELEKRNVVVEVKNFCRAKNAISKIWEYFLFRKYIFTKLKRLSFDALWVEGGNTILALGPSLRKYPFYLQISELYEKNHFTLKAIGRIIYKAKRVFMPEYNRCVLYQCWFHLPSLPTLLPNKPYFLPKTSDLLKFEEKYEKELRYFKDKKVILYQGHIGANRDLTSFVKAINLLDEEFILVLVGRYSGMVEKYKSISDKVFHIDFIPAPEYLLFTSKAYVGILGYNPISLNNVYCAPNKIFEYSAYGKPMLGNNIPGLLCIQNYEMGCVVDENNELTIVDSINKINENYEYYSQNAYNFFNRIDNKKTIQLSLTM